MKLLVLAHVPPPVHGQSVMVQTLVGELPTHGVPLHHVNLRLSRDAADIGRLRPGKIATVLVACARALAARFREGCDTLYYVPAPGKRGALWRDLVVMALCRPFFPRLVLHWHAAGLGAWLATHASAPERGLARFLLGRADLSLVLADNLRADAEALHACRIVAVPNGIPDPAPAATPRDRAEPDAFQVLFLGLCSDEKGLFAAIQAVLAANQAAGADAASPRFTLVAAGPFDRDATALRFEALRRQFPAALRHVGPVHGADKDALFRSSQCLCLPTRYPAEGQPLVLLEAMAYDLPIVATRWAGIAAMLPPAALLVEPGDDRALAAALTELARRPPPAGTLRRHYLAHYTVPAHLAALAAALRSL